jgi:hypothetical protein
MSLFILTRLLSLLATMESRLLAVIKDIVSVVMLVIMTRHSVFQMLVNALLLILALIKIKIFNKDKILLNT